MANNTPFTVHSKLSGGIEDMGLLERSLLFSELARISYHVKETAFEITSALGFEHQQFLDKDGSQAFVFESDTDCVVACREEPSPVNGMT